MDNSSPGSLIHRDSQVRILERVAISFSRGSSLPRDRTHIYPHWQADSLSLRHQGIFSSVQSLSHVWLFSTPWTTACQASLSITDSWSLLKLMSIESVMPSNRLILCHPLLLLPSIFPSIRVFSNESALCIRWPKCWSFSLNISPSSEHSRLISFRMDWLDLLAVQRILKILLQHRSSKASVLCAQLSIESNSHFHTWPLEKT